MVAAVIDGTEFAATVREKVADHVTRIKEENGLTPGLAVVLGWRRSGQQCLRSLKRQEDS